MSEKKYRIKSWILVKDEKEELMARNDALLELAHLIELQPENKYEIEEVEETKEEENGRD